MIELGIALSLACACATNVSFLCKHRGAIAAPQVRFRHPWRSARNLFASRWWTIGFAIAAGAWILHVAALALAPLSTVQMLISGGLVLLAYPAERWFGIKLGPRQWAGLALSAGGLALLAVSSDPSSTHSSYSVSAMIAFEAAAIAVGIALLLGGHRTDRPGRGHGAAFGAAAGLLVGVSDVSIKALTGTVPSEPLSILGPWSFIALAAGVLAFFALAKGLQTGEAIAVITLSSIAANCSAILGGVLVFGDPLGNGTFEIMARSLAFAAVIAAAALMPAPRHAAPSSA
jgi:drug/metabolite transporter (DMT)-like permease